MAADSLRRLGGFGLLIAFLSVLSVTDARWRSQAAAADYAPPTVSSWQRLEAGRLAIEWQDTARVRQKRTGDRLTLRFARPLLVDLDGAIRKVSSFVDPKRTFVDDQDLVLTLRRGVVADVEILEKRIVTIDFSRDPAELHDGSAVPASIEASTTDQGMRLTFHWPKPTDVTAIPKPGRLYLQIPADRSLAPNDLAYLRTNLRPWFESVRMERRPNRTMVTFALEPDIVPSVRSAGPVTTVIDLVRDASRLPEPAAGPSDQVFIPEKKPSLAAAAAWPPVPKRRPGSTAALSAADGGIEDAEPPDALVFDWDGPVGAAVFLRAGYLWTVFDEPDGDLLERLPPSPSVFAPGSFVRADGGTAIRFRLNEPVNVEVSRTEDGRWRVAPGSDRDDSRAVTVERVGGSKALLLTPAAGRRVVGMIDPTVGDRIVVLPLAEAGLGQPIERRHVDLELLATVQGLAWRPLNDLLSARLDQRGLELGAPGGLSLSASEHTAATHTSEIRQAMAPKAPHDQGKSREPVEQDALADRGPSYFDLSGRGVERALVADTRRILRQAIGKAPLDERDQARLDLARLLVSEHLAIEARTVLADVADREGSDLIPQKNALLGAAAFLIGRLDEAAERLGDPSLDGDDEIEIWRAALESRNRNWQAAAERWSMTGDILDHYPPRLRLDLGLLAAEVAIEIDDDDMARQSFKRLDSLPLNARGKDRVETMLALKAERDGDLERARELFSALADSPYQKIRAFADFQLAALDLEGDAGDDPGAASTLDDHLALWRGHPDERFMLDRLAHRFRDDDGFRAALNLWHRLIDHFPDAGADEDLTKTRQTTFVRALTDADEAAFGPADPYAIYLDFEDLMPEDERSLSVRRHLAQHLTELDLADQAITVLKGLVDSSANGAERAGFALEAARLLLQEGRAEEALPVIDRIDDARPALPESLEQRRRLTRARILTALDRVDDALQEIEGLQIQPARRLRAEILWTSRRWPRLAAAVESYFADDGPASSLTAEEQRLVLWLALARAREGEADRLRDLRARFGDAMRAGPHGEAFDVATQGPPEARDLQTLLTETDRRIGEIRRFRAAAAP